MSACPTCGKPNCGNWAACSRRKQAERDNESKRKIDEEHAHKRASVPSIFPSLETALMFGMIVEDALNESLARVVKAGEFTQAQVDALTTQDRMLLKIELVKKMRREG
jgi:hypothetical protein